jgi:hypothetical protein
VTLALYLGFVALSLLAARRGLACRATASAPATASLGRQIGTIRHWKLLGPSRVERVAVDES